MRKISFPVLAFLFILSSLVGQAQTPTPDYLIAGIYNQNDPRISITGSYESSLDGTYYLGDAASFGVYTSDLATGGTATASTATFGAASNAFDNNNGTVWASNTVAHPHWLEYQLTSSNAILRYTMTAATDFVTRTPGTWVFQGWNGSVWITVDSRSGITWSAGEKKTFDVGTELIATRWRVLISNNSGDNSNSRIAEMELLAANDFIIDFDFYGDSFLLYTQKNPSPRSIQICVDSNCNGIGLYSSTSQISSISVSGLTVGVHSVSIQSVSGGGSNAFIFDAIEIQPDFGSADINVNVQITLAAPATETFRIPLEYDSEGTAYPAAFEYTATTGDVMISQGIYAIILLLVLIFMVVIWGVLRWQKQ